MHIEIQSNGNIAGKDLQHYARRWADIAFGPFRDQIGLVSVFIDRADQAEGGDAIRCLVLIRLSSQPDILVEQTHANPYLAVLGTVDNAGWTLAERLMQGQRNLLFRQYGVFEDQRADREPGPAG